MKKLFFAAAVLMCSLTAFAQTKEGSFNILPKAGINISTLSNKDNAEVKVGITAGAEVEYIMTRQLSLSAGALFFYARCQIYDCHQGCGCEEYDGI